MFGNDCELYRHSLCRDASAMLGCLSPHRILQVKRRERWLGGWGYFHLAHRHLTENVNCTAMCNWTRMKPLYCILHATREIKSKWSPDPILYSVHLVLEYPTGVRKSGAKGYDRSSVWQCTISELCPDGLICSSYKWICIYWATTVIQTLFSALEE